MAGRAHGVVLVVLAACGFEHGRLGGTADGGADVDAVTMIDANPGAIGIGPVANGNINYALFGMVDYTVPAGTSLLVVTLSISYAGTNASAVRWNGAAFLQHGFVNAPSDDGRVELWYLLDPLPGTGTITATIGNESSTVMVGIASFTNTHMTAALGMFNGAMANQGDPSVTLPSAADQVVIGAVLWNGSYALLTPGAGQTNNWNTVQFGVTGAGSLKTDTATTTIRWAVEANRNDYWALGAAAIKPR